MLKQHVNIETQIQNLIVLIQSSSLSLDRKEDLSCRLHFLQTDHVSTLCAQSSKAITSTNLRYILCFLINMDVPDIALLFHVDTGSVYSARYRLRKLFVQKPVMPF